MRLPPLKVTVPPPLGAVSVPPQVVTGLAGVARVTPAGRVSVKARSVIGVPWSLPMENTSRLVLPGPMVSGWKTLEKDG